MLSGFENISSVIKVKMMPQNQLSDIFMLVRLDNPLIFYVENFKMRWAENASHIEILPEYMFDKSKIKTHIQAVNARIDRLKRELKCETTSKTLLAIHDFICNNIKYDKLKKAYSHEIIGPLTHGIGVCDGISKTVKVLCDTFNIECVIPLSEADPDNGVKYRHAWNVVKLDGKWYHCDFTYDNSLGRYGVLRYDYCNLDDKRIYRDHRLPIFGIPECTDSGNFYYKTQKLSYTKIEDVKNRISQALRKKKETFLFHWRGGYLTREVLTEILTAAAEAAAAHEKFVRASINYAQSVILLVFTADSPLQPETEEVPDEA